MPVAAWLRSVDGTTAYEDTGFERTVTCTAAAFLTTELLSAVSILTAVLCLSCSLTLISEVLYYIEVDSVVIRSDTEHPLIESYLLSGICSVNFVNRLFFLINVFVRDFIPGAKITIE